MRKGGETTMGKLWPASRKISFKKGGNVKKGVMSEEREIKPKYNRKERRRINKD